MLSADEFDLLIENARCAADFAYAPYSRILIGAAVMTDSGNIYKGCNIENASYGLTICAERSAIFNAVSNGERKINAIAIAESEGGIVYPCGACRQVLNEFCANEDISIYIVSSSGIEKHMLSELFPFAFRL